MKSITYCITLVMWLLSMAYCYAQEEGENRRIQLLNAAKEAVINEEKDALRKEVEAINSRLEEDQITMEEAERLKQQAAERRALNIENRVGIINHKIELVQRNGDTNDENDFSVFSINLGRDESSGKSIFGVSFKDVPQSERVYDRRTKSEFVFSFGLNNAIIEGQSLSDSPYKIAGSRFAEIGLSWKTRILKESNVLRFKYGVSFQFNGLKPTDNRYVVDMGRETTLEEFPIDMDKSKFRMDHLVIPLHLEIGGSKKIEKETYFRYDDDQSFKLGIGGYAGINLGTRQKLKYVNEGERVKEKLRGNYNTNNFIYGLSAYVGVGDLSLYAKYDLNTIFRNNPIEQRNVSLGLRWDWD